MVDAFDDVYFYSFVEVKNNNSRYYTYLEDNKSSYVSLLEYESDILRSLIHGTRLRQRF